jgi:hypothetical protein
MAPHDKKWDDSAERDLCVAIILGNQDNTKGRQNWPRIAEIMDGLGYSFSKDAMSYVYHPLLNFSLFSSQIQAFHCFRKRKRKTERSNFNQPTLLQDHPERFQSPSRLCRYRYLGLAASQRSEA